MTTTVLMGNDLRQQLGSQVVFSSFIVLSGLLKSQIFLLSGQATSYVASIPEVIQQFTGLRLPQQ